MFEIYQKNQKHIQFAALFAAAFLAIKFIVPLIMPLIVAFILIAPINPVLRRIHERNRIGKGFLASIFIMLVAVTLIILIWLGSIWLFHAVGNLAMNMDKFEGEFAYFLKHCCRMAEKNFGVNAVEIETLVLERVNIFVETLQVDILPKTVNISVMFLKKTFAAIMFLVITLIAAVLLAKDFDNIRDKICHMRGFHELCRVITKIGKLLGGFLKAQLIILAAISLICITGIWLSGMSRPVAWGIAAGVLDVLPFVGTGVILLPMAIWMFVKGEVIKGLILCITFVLGAVAREILEPKLVGKQMGVFPIIFLISVWAGLKAFGLLGVIWGPVFVLVILEGYKNIYTE